MRFVAFILLCTVGGIGGVIDGRSLGPVFWYGAYCCFVGGFAAYLTTRPRDEG